MAIDAGEPGKGLVAGLGTDGGDSSYMDAFKERLPECDVYDK